MLLLMVTDCGSELTTMYSFANALRSVLRITVNHTFSFIPREAFSPDLPVLELPAHIFVQSIHNTW